MKAIAARDEITLQLDLLLLVDNVDGWLAGSDVSQPDVADVEKDLSPLLQACGNQILEDFMLRINHNAPPVRQFG